MTGPWESRLLWRHVTDDGLPDGSPNLLVAGSLAAPAYFWAGPGENVTWEVAELIFALEWAAAAPQLLRWSNFGARAPLTNGLAFYKRLADGTPDPIWYGQPIKANVEWRRVVEADVALLDGEAGLQAHLSQQADGAPLILRPGEQVVVGVMDNLTSAGTWASLHLKGRQRGLSQ